MRVICSILLFSAVATSSALEVEFAPDRDLEGFVTEFRLAAQRNDVAGIRALTHIGSTACADAGAAAYYDRIVAGIIRVFGDDQAIASARYEAIDQASLDRTAASMARRGITWPVRPDGKVTMRYQQATGARVANLHVAQDEGGWKWLHVCKV